MILVGDCLLLLPTLEPASVDSIVTDPPYHLTTGKKGGTGVASLNPNSPAGRARIGTGFMGQAWDGGDIAFRPETWSAMLRVAKPGAYLAAFGHVRTFHRLMVAIEDAGWELRDTLMWVYGSGFPKNKNLGNGMGTALKPSWEPIVLARAPFKGSATACHETYGTAGLNIDACRILTPGEIRAPITGKGAIPARHDVDQPREGTAPSQPNAQGRWPANVAHDGSAEVVALFPDKAGQRGALTGNEPSKPFTGTYNPTMPRSRAVELRVDTGGASRFFYSSKASTADRDDGLEDMEKEAAVVKNESGRGYSETDPYADVMRANTHPTVKPTNLMRWLCRLVTPPGGIVLDPFMGSGSTGKAARLEGMEFVGIEEKPKFAAIAQKRIDAAQPGLAL